MANDEAIVNNLKNLINTLNNNIVVYENDMDRSLKKLKNSYDISDKKDVENLLDAIDEERKQLLKRKSDLISEAESMMNKYSEEIEALKNG